MFENIFLPKSFESVHLIKIFEHLLIATSTGAGRNGAEEYFIPSVLGILPKKELTIPRRELLNTTTPLVIHFDGGLSHCGVFCCLQVHLMKERKWKLVCKDQRRQNIAKFSVPGCSGTITLIDLISHFEVYIVQGDCKIFHEAKVIIRKGISVAHEKLKLKCSAIELGFICPCPEPGDHPAVIECNTMRCTVHEDRCYDLGNNHQVWLEEPAPLLQG